MFQPSMFPKIFFETIWNSQFSEQLQREGFFQIHTYWTETFIFCKQRSSQNIKKITPKVRKILMRYFLTLEELTEREKKT